MEHLVREELNRWDSETSVIVSGVPGASSEAGVYNNLPARSRLESAEYLVCFLLSLKCFIIIGVIIIVWISLLYG